MLLGVCLGTNDLLAAAEFYDKVLGTLGMVRTMEADNEVGYGPAGGASCFWILTLTISNRQPGAMAPR